MLPFNLQPIIWPLRARLFQPVFMQQRPKFTGGRRIPSLPTLPWMFKDRPLNGRINFGRYDMPPIFAQFGGDRFATSQPTSRPTSRPAVVHVNPPAARYCFDGISRDSTGAVLGSCDVKLFRADTDTVTGRVTSGTDGTWKICSNNGGAHYLVEYKSGAPDVAGTSLRTLIGS